MENLVLFLIFIQLKPDCLNVVLVILGHLTEKVNDSVFIFFSTWLCSSKTRRVSFWLGINATIRHQSPSRGSGN